MENSNRPTFYTKEGLPVRAAGILCYVVHKEQQKEKNYWLFRLQNKLFTDTGGKTDILDSDMIDTAIRETVEETNGHLFSFKHNFDKCTSILKNLFKIQNPKPIYIKSCKYVVYPLRLKYKNKFLSLKRFGLKEEHDNIEHKYMWLDYVPKNIHPRLKSLKGYLKEFDNLKKPNSPSICI